MLSIMHCLEVTPSAAKVRLTSRHWLRSLTRHAAMRSSIIWVLPLRSIDLTHCRGAPRRSNPLESGSVGDGEQRAENRTDRSVQLKNAAVGTARAEPPSSLSSDAAGLNYSQSRLDDRRQGPNETSRETPMASCWASGRGLNRRARGGL